VDEWRAMVQTVEQKRLRDLELEKDRKKRLQREYWEQLEQIRQIRQDEKRSVAEREKLAAELELQLK